MKNTDVLVERFSEILEQKGVDREAIRNLLPIMHAADLALILEDLDADGQVQLMNLLDPETAGQVLDEVDESTAERLLPRLGEDFLRRILEQMPASSGADLLDLVPDDREAELLSKVEKESAGEIRDLMQYEPDTAGGLMTTDYLEVSESDTARDILQKIQGQIEAETAPVVYVVDDAGRLVGEASFRAILMARPQDPIRDFMERDLISATVDEDQEEIARRVTKYDAAALPIVDANGVLQGIVTVDDVLEVVEEEASEDIYRLAGTGTIHPVHAPVLQRVLARAPWLIPTLGGELVVAGILRGYSSTLPETFRTLSWFVPIIMAMGGNVGLQSSTLMVRGLATGEVTLARTLRVVIGEFGVGVWIGLACGIATAGASMILHGDTHLAATIAVAMLVGVTFAALTGTLIPLGCFRIGIDPAITAGPFITALNDITATTIYFGTAMLFL